MKLLKSLIYDIYTLILASITIKYLYNWFVPSLFEVSSIGYMQAAGIAILTTYLTLDIPKMSEQVGEEVNYILRGSTAFCAAVYCLLIGFVIHILM